MAKKIKLNNNGFTLVELISVILVLVIIALIAVPSISKLLEETKKNAFINTANNTINAAEKDCNRALLKGKGVERNINFLNNKITNDEKLSIKGKLPLQGDLSINKSCDTAIAVNNNKWCVSKTYSDKKVSVKDYVDGNCSISDGRPLLVDKINELRGSELFDGDNLGDDEYDDSIPDYDSFLGYYSIKSFKGANPNNYIKIDGKEFRILSLDKQGISVIGDAEDYIYYDNTQYKESLNDDFYKKFNDLGLVKSFIRFRSNSYSESENYWFGTYYDKLHYTNRYNTTIRDNFSMLSLFDYERSINRNDFAKCLKDDTIAESNKKLFDCSPVSWLGDNIKLYVRFFFSGTGTSKEVYLKDGKLITDNFENDYINTTCDSCKSKIKLLIRNDSYYVSGTGTKTDPFIYESNYDKNNFTSDSCYFLDETGHKIVDYDFINDDCPKNLVIPASINGNEITEIGNKVFSKSKIEGVDFSKAVNLINIGDYAFSEINLQNELKLPINLKKIGDHSFYNSNISGELIIPKSVEEIKGSAFLTNNIDKVIFEDNSKISKLDGYVFSRNNIVVISLPNSLTNISTYAFEYAYDLKTIYVDKEYNELSGFPWGSNATNVVWLRAKTYNLTYDNSQIKISDNCLMDDKYIAGCKATITSVNSNESINSFMLNGEKITSNEFIIPNKDSSITDIELSKPVILESNHNYESNLDKTYTATIPGATKIKVLFSSDTLLENSYDKIYLTDMSGNQVGSSSYSGTSLANQSFIVNGNVINIRLKTDGSVNKYGFYATVTKYE